jgi:CCR4-NOT transcription complex subunit 6
MADGSYPYQQRAGQQYYYPQPGHSTHHQRQPPRNTGSPVSSGRAPFSADTPSPSRSPTPQSPANLYGIYNNQNHQQQAHGGIMNGNQNAQRFPMQMAMGSKYPQQHHPHAQHVDQHHHQQQQHQDHNVHGGATNHQHTYSSGGLSNATPHFTPNTIQNGGPTNGHGGMGKPVSEFWSQQLQLAAESRQGSSPHHNARTNVNVNKILITSAPAQNQKEGENERNRARDQDDKKKQDWVALDIGGQGLRSLAMAVFNYDFLNTLYLNHNRLTYIPPAIGRMRSLTHLDISGNQLTELPAEMGMLVKLKSLLVFDNLLRGLPFELGSLYRLDTLGIEGNPINDEMRSELMQNGTASLINYLREQAPGMYLGDLRYPLLTGFSYTPTVSTRLGFAKFLPRIGRRKIYSIELQHSLRKICYQSTIWIHTVTCTVVGIQERADPGRNTRTECRLCMPARN